MKLILLNLLILGLSSLWMGCECDQAGGKMQGKQCKKDSDDASGAVSTNPADNSISSVHIRDIDGQAIRTPVDLGWDEVSGAAYYMVRLHERGGDCSASSSLYELRVEAPASHAVIDPEVADGEYTLCVVAYDGSDQVLQPIQSSDITIDNTAPQGLVGDSVFGATAEVQIVLTLPADADDFQSIDIYRSAPLGVMPECTGTAKKSWARAAISDDAVLTLDDSVDAAFAGYALNYMVCAYDAVGNVAKFPLANVRTTQMEHVLFFSDNYDGSLGGMAGADAKCQAEANVTMPAKKWKAIIADNSTSVVDHVSMRGPVKNMQGTVVARSMNQLLDELAVDVKFDESAAAVSGLVWTGSAPDGSPVKGKNCLNWSSNSPSYSAAYGDLASGNFVGSGQSANGACSITKRLACVTQVDPKPVSSVSVAVDGGNALQVNIAFDYSASSKVEIRRQNGAAAVSGSCVDPSDVVVDTIDALDGAAGSYSGTDVHDSFGRYSYRICVFDQFGGPAVSSMAVNSVVAQPTSFEEIFVTADSVQGNMSGSDPDALCAAAGTRAGLSSGWVALISDLGQDASSLLSNSLPMMDLTAQTIVNDASSIWSESHQAPIAINEFADAVEANAQVWTGTNTNGSKAGPTDVCNDWSNNSSGSTGFVGVAGGSGSQWILKSGTPSSACNNFKRLYCIRN
ncbi:DUF1554 domain-containing protein [Oligoflexaceae bacterium]|nr:DUF1554 domain-containing protein [Oligoflexaceae bacterium]